MSQRSIDALKLKAQQSGVSVSSIFRRWRWRGDGNDKFMPDDGPLGWYCRADDGEETFLGDTLDAAMATLSNWNESHGTGRRHTG
jgi:hypothetical protein